MTDDTTPGQIAYAAYGRTTNNLNYQGLPMPAWGDLGGTIRQAWENAAAATAQPTSDAVRGVQGWMALDLHLALGRPVDHAAENQGYDSWADWWAQLCADVRSLAAPEQSDLRQRIAQAVPFCRDGCDFCEPDQVTDAVLAVVRDELAALREQVADAEQRAEQWEQARDGEVLATTRVFHEYYRRWESTVVEARRQARRADASEAELAKVRAEVAAVLALPYPEKHDRMDPAQYDYAEAYGDGLEAAKRAIVTAAPAT